jgi:hypothetical protein
MPLVTKIGLCELAFAGLTGYAVLGITEARDWMVAHGVRSPRRIMQAHLDYIMMGTILIAVGLALDPVPAGVAIPLVFGALMNPTLFVPQAFSDTVKERALFKLVGLVSIVAMSGSLVAAAVVGLGR